MFWIYALVGTAGIVALVPEILRAIDGHPTDLPRGLIGFFGTTFGAIGTLLNFTSLRLIITLALAIMFGAAAAAVHAEILGDLRKRNLTHEDV